VKLQSLEFGRYRGFREVQRLVLSRLSLVYGENNAGKSALVRIPSILADSRAIGRPGLEMDSAALKGAAFREVQWRGPLPDEEDPDLTLGVGLADGTAWRWTCRWSDTRAQPMLQRLTITSATDSPEWELQEPGGRATAEYVGPDGVAQMAFDGLIPRPGASRVLDEHRGDLSAALDGVVWLGALRKGPERGGSPRGARGSLSGDGSGAGALVMGDATVRRATSEWFAQHTGYEVIAESLGAELERLVLRPVGRLAYDIAFPDSGEGLQQVFPVVAALERLRRDGGLLTIEEPESHLHPRLQRGLAELIVGVLVQQPQASVMLETHSEVFLLAALGAAIRDLAGAVRLYWVDAGQDGAATVEDVALSPDGRPTTPRMEQAFATMGVMRRELLDARRQSRGG
jgi:hypothetical protein